eukprot:GHVN01068681.1.p1 GENE.GHVN01068681.1~~GHVN01068681.1.p1  ORF type:complete len:199 (+),score=42.68 GHVN01068681.1:326-922(+)
MSYDQDFSINQDPSQSSPSFASSSDVSEEADGLIHPDSLNLSDLCPTAACHQTREVDSLGFAPPTDESDFVTDELTFPFDSADPSHQAHSEGLPHSHAPIFVHDSGVTRQRPSEASNVPQQVTDTSELVTDHADGVKMGGGRRDKQGSGGGGSQKGCTSQVLWAQNPPPKYLAPCVFSSTPPSRREVDAANPPPSKRH